jgi:hypothetical protein
LLQEAGYSRFQSAEILDSHSQQEGRSMAAKLAKK